MLLSVDSSGSYNMSITGFLNSVGTMPEESDYMEDVFEVDFDNLNKKTLIHNDFIEYKEGYKYQLHRTVAFKLNFNPCIDEDIITRYIMLTVDGWLIIKWGYAWDGASGPTYDSNNTMRASLVHDALYQLMRMGLLNQSFRKVADRELYEIMRDDGATWLRASYYEKGVRVLGASAASPKNIKKIYTAPKQKRLK